MEWWKSSGPGELKTEPFLHPAVIDYMGGLLRPDWRILEFGSGGSTVWFSARCASVTSVETDADWYAAIHKRVGENVNLILRQDGDLPKPERVYDLLLIDGEPLEMRAKWINAAFDYVKDGGWVVLDNCNRPQFEQERAWLQSVCKEYTTYNGNGNFAKYLVTEFYKL